MMRITYNGRDVTALHKEPEFVARVERQASDSRIERGRKAWKALHQAAAVGMLSEKWLETWETTIPSYGCQCRKSWKEIRKRIPLRPGDQVRWAANVHNAVNEKLGKPLWPTQKGPEVDVNQ